MAEETEMTSTSADTAAASASSDATLESEQISSPSATKLEEQKSEAKIEGGPKVMKPSAKEENKQKIDSSATPPKVVRLSSAQKIKNSISSFQKRFTLTPKKTDDVETQTALFNSQDTIWFAVKSGNIELARNMCKKKPELLAERGPVGENPIHLCFLFNQPVQLELARELLTSHPEYFDAIYENETYHGETYLHIAIVNKDLTMVSWLLERKPELLYMRADGIFFAPSKKGVTCYYGEYPLAFACSTNNFPMFEYLLSLDPLQLWQQDSHGNTLLHMCVMYGLEEMYLFVQSMEKKVRNDLQEGKNDKTLPSWDLQSARNKDGYTALTLSTVHKGTNANMTNFIINAQKQTQWSYGPVSCVLYPLLEVDTFSSKMQAARWSKEGLGEKQGFKDRQGKFLGPPTSALDLVIESAALDTLMSDYFKDLLHKKWISYAGFAFYMRCFQTTIFILALTLGQLMGFPNFDVYSQDSNSRTGLIVGRFITDLIVILGLLYKGNKELSELYESGWGYFNMKGVAFLENNLSFSLLLTLPLSIILQNVPGETAQMASYFFVSISVLIAWSYTFALLLGFQLTGPFVIMIWKMMVSDVLRFVLIFLVLLFGFAASFTGVLDTSDFESSAEYFQAFAKSLYTLFMVMLGEVDFEGFNENTIQQYKWFNSILLLMYVMVMTIALLNLLIAMMGDTYSAVKESADSEWHYAYAQIIMSVEEEMNFKKYFEANPAAHYWVEIEGQRYLQVMEVNQNYYKAIRSESSLKIMDTNNDGEVSIEELRVGLLKMGNESRNKLLSELGLEQYASELLSRRRPSVLQGLGPQGPKVKVDQGQL